MQLFEIGRAAADHVSVLFTAQGVDGMFGGMPWHRLLWLMKILPPLRGALAELHDLTQQILKPKTVGGRALAWACFRGKVPAVPVIEGAQRPPESLELPASDRNFINMVLAGGLQAGQCVQKFERTFCASGVRQRAVFYDPQFFRTAFTVDERHKIRPRIEKYVFRKAAASIFPEEFLWLPKGPQIMKYDLAFSEALDNVAASVLSIEAIERRGFFRYVDIEALGRRPRGWAYAAEGAMRLWTAIATELWAQLFIDRGGRRLNEKIRV